MLCIRTNSLDEGPCHLKRGKFFRTCFVMCATPAASLGPEHQLRIASCRLRRRTHAGFRTLLNRSLYLESQKEKTAKARNRSRWPYARDAAPFPTPQTSSTDSVGRWSQARGVSESMEAPSTPTIGNNVMLVREQGAQEQFVAAVVMGRAGCTRVRSESARRI